MNNWGNDGLLPTVLQSSEETANQKLAEVLAELRLADVDKEAIIHLGTMVLRETVGSEDIPHTLRDFFEPVGDVLQIHPSFSEPLKRLLKEKLVGFKSPATRSNGEEMR